MCFGFAEIFKNKFCRAFTMELPWKLLQYEFFGTISMKGVIVNKSQNEGESQQDGAKSSRSKMKCQSDNGMLVITPQRNFFLPYPSSFTNWCTFNINFLEKKLFCLGAFWSETGLVISSMTSLRHHKLPSLYAAFFNALELTSGQSGLSNEWSRVDSEWNRSAEEIDGNNREKSSTLSRSFHVLALEIGRLELVQWDTFCIPFFER